MAYKFKVGDKASFMGKEGTVVKVDKGVVLNYKVQWKEGHCDWFQGKNLDKVISKPEPPVPPKYGAPKFKVGDKVLITVDNPMCSFYKKDDTGVVAGITSNRPNYVSYGVKSTEEGRTAYVEECYLLPYKSDIIFTTKDGVDVRNGDKVYWVLKIKDEVRINSGTWNKDANDILPDLTYFSSEKLATECKKELERKTVEFKIGDTVKLIANTSSSGNNVGDVGEVFEITTRDGKQTGCRVRVLGGRDFALWSRCTDLELVAKAKVKIIPKAITEFKVGDIVKLTGNEAGSCNQVGDVGEILEIDGHQCKVQVPGGDTTANWSYKDDLELTTKIEKTMTLQEQIIKDLDLQVGDVVKITHAVPTGNLGWKGGWVSDMNNTIGKEGIVKSISSTHVSVAVEGIITHVYPAQVLQFVSRGPKYKEMQLTRDYNAKVYPDRIEVGCQTITMENFKTLQKLVTEMTKK